MTPQEYSQHLLRIERDNPTEVLLPALRSGWSRANEMYLRAALKRLNPTPCPSLERRGAATNTVGHRGTLYVTPPFGGGVGGGVADDNLRALWAERTRLFGEMNKMSNHFHDCKTDAERAANSAAILHKWQEILAAKAKIAHYEEHGELPAEPEEEDILPENPVLLSKKLNSFRAGISQTKAKLEAAASLDDATPGKAANIEKLEAKLKRLKHLSGLAEVKLKSYESAT